MLKYIRLAAVSVILTLDHAAAQTGSSKTTTVLNAEVNQLFPDQNAGLITPAVARQTLLDMIASAGSLQGANTWIATQTITPPAGLSSGLIVNTNGSGATSANPFEYNQFNCITDNVNATNVGVCASVYHGYGGSSTSPGRISFFVNSQLLAATSASNPARFYTSGSFVSSPLSGDGGGIGTEKGAFFALNPVVQLCATCANTAGVSVGEVDVSIPVGGSTLDKYAWTLVQLSTDKVAGSRNDSALLFGNQSGAVGWGTLIQIGDGLNQNPLKTTGTILALKGSPTIANGIDLSGAGSITGSAFKSNLFSVDGSGNTKIGNPASGFALAVQHADSSATALFAGTTKGIRIGNGASGSQIEGTDNTGVSSFQPLTLNGSTLTFQTNGGTTALTINASQHISSGGPTPTNNACTGFSLATGSTDTAGKVSFTSATSCVINFGAAFTNAPFCNVTPGTSGTPSTVDVVTATGTLTATFTTAQTSMYWHCFGA